MKIIRITTDLEMTVHDFPEGTHEEQNHELRELIGNDCRIYEHVMPERLYTNLKMKNRPTKVPGQCVSMLIDEEGLLKPNHASHQYHKVLTAYCLVPSFQIRNVESPFAYCPGYEQ